MNVVYISASDPTSSIGGAANTASNWIDKLLENDVEVDIICRGDADTSVDHEGVTITQLSGLSPYEKMADQLARGEYDVALIQDLWADIALEAAAANDIPTVLSLTTTHAVEEVVSEFAPTRFIANSQYTQQWITSIWGRDSTVVYPHIDFDFYTAPDGSADTISMINPIEMKGTSSEQSPSSSLNGRSWRKEAGTAFGTTTSVGTSIRSGFRRVRSTAHRSVFLTRRSVGMVPQTSVSMISRTLRLRVNQGFWMCART